MGKSRFSVIPLLVIAILAAVLVFTREIWLGAMGQYLIQAESPAPADVAVVLAGDGHGNRILTGAELVRKGLVKKALVSGPTFYYGMNEADLAVAFAVKRGFPESYFVKVKHEALSTEEEARAMIAELRRLEVKNFLLVTSDYHTRRAGRIFRPKIPDMRMRVVAAPTEHFEWNKWWHNREGMKTFYMEWSKLVFGLFGI